MPVIEMPHYYMLVLDDVIIALKLNRLLRTIQIKVESVVGDIHVKNVIMKYKKNLVSSYE